MQTGAWARPRGRIRPLGLDAQRLLASGTGPLNPIDMRGVEEEMEALRKLRPGLVALSGHDSSDEVIQHFREAFGPAPRGVRGRRDPASIARTMTAVSDHMNMKSIDLENSYLKVRYDSVSGGSGGLAGFLNIEAGQEWVQPGSTPEFFRLILPTETWRGHRIDSSRQTSKLAVSGSETRNVT